MTVLLRWLGLDGVTVAQAVEQWTWRMAARPPDWALWTVAGVGLLLSALVFLPRLSMRPRVRVLTFLLRLGMVGIVLLALGQVELVARLRIVKPQHWRVLLDDSGSMGTADVAGQTRYAAAVADLERIRRAAGSGTRVESVALDGLRPPDEPGQGPTHLYAAIARQALRGEPIDRLIVLSDGRDVAAHDFTRLGNDVRAAGVDLAVRVYGSTQHVAAATVFAEPDRDVIRLGEDLVVQGSILSSAAADAEMRLLEDGEEVMTTVIPPDRQRAFTLTYRPEAEGLRQYTVELVGAARLEGGHDSASFMVEVVPERIRVLMIEGFPRYEFKFWRYVLDSDPLIDLVTIVHLPGGGVYVQGDPLHANPEQGIIGARADLFRYDVVILRDVPRNLFRAGGDMSESRLQLIRQFVEDRGGGLIMGGGRDAYRAGGYADSALAAVTPFDLGSAYGEASQFPGRFFVTVEHGLYHHPILRLLPDDAANIERWRALRELDGCNNVGRPRPLATTLLSRRLERTNHAGEIVDLNVPVMVYQPFGEGKVIAATVDTLWRWQLQPDFDDPPLRMLLANMVRYVAPRPGETGEPHVRLRDRAPQVGGEAVLYTLLRDDQYRPVRRADLTITVTTPSGRVEHMYPVDTAVQPGYYEYRIPLDEGGVYAVEAAYGRTTRRTRFIAGATRDEFADLSADPETMARLVEAAGGELIADVADWLRRAGARPAVMVSRRILPLWNSPLVLIVFIGLVALDCYIRKRQGLA